MLPTMGFYERTKPPTNPCKYGEECDNVRLKASAKVANSLVNRLKHASKKR